MAEKDFCSNCGQRQGCRQAYEQLGSLAGASVVMRVITAFLLPLLVFVVGLVVFEYLLGSIVNSTNARTVVSFLPAVSVSIVWILFVRFARNRIAGAKSCRVREGEEVSKSRAD